MIEMQELTELIKLLKRHGVTSYKSDGIELTLAPKQQRQVSTKPASDETMVDKLFELPWKEPITDGIGRIIPDWHSDKKDPRRKVIG